MHLWRPVGLHELRLIYDSGMKAFPARLVDQPIFYPVTNEGYACQIARDWNTREATRAGYVLTFTVPDPYGARFERQIVGGSQHEELWVPAEGLADFNARIEGSISLVRAFFGAGFRGHCDPIPSFGGLDDAFHTGEADAQLRALERLRQANRLEEAIRVYNRVLFLTFPWWAACVTAARPVRSTSDVREVDPPPGSTATSALLAEIDALWTRSFVTPLCRVGMRID